LTMAKMTISLPALAILVSPGIGFLKTKFPEVTFWRPHSGRKS